MCMEHDCEAPREVGNPRCFPCSLAHLNPKFKDPDAIGEVVAALKHDFDKVRRQKQSAPPDDPKSPLDILPEKHPVAQKTCRNQECENSAVPRNYGFCAVHRTLKGTAKPKVWVTENSVEEVCPDCDEGDALPLLPGEIKEVLPKLKEQFRQIRDTQALGRARNDVTTCGEHFNVDGMNYNPPATDDEGPVVCDPFDYNYGHLIQEMFKDAEKQEKVEHRIKRRIAAQLDLLYKLHKALAQEASTCEKQGKTSDNLHLMHYSHKCGMDIESAEAMKKDLIAGAQHGCRSATCVCLGCGIPKKCKLHNWLTTQKRTGVPQKLWPRIVKIACPQICLRG